MTACALEGTITRIADRLLTLSPDPRAITASLADAERLVAQVALASAPSDHPDPHLANRFLALQDTAPGNLAAILLEWLTRSLLSVPDSPAAATPPPRWPTWIRGLRLLQGLVLLHRPSQRLFARRASCEYLLAVLDHARAYLPATPSPCPSPALSHSGPTGRSPAPSPVLFPSSPVSSPSLAQGPPTGELAATQASALQLSLAALDVLLCALVDQPANVRVLEDLDGLAVLVKILKDKALPQPVRIKVVELLYFYLLPETPTPVSFTDAFSSSTSVSSRLDGRVLATDSQRLPSLLAAAADFVPQTPRRPRTVQRSAGSTALAPSLSSSSSGQGAPSSSGRASTSTAGSASSREPSPTRRTPRTLRHQRSQSLTSFKSSLPPTTGDPIALTPATASPRFSRSVAARPRPSASSVEPPSRSDGERSSARPFLPPPSPRKTNPFASASASASGSESDSTPRPRRRSEHSVGQPAVPGGQPPSISPSVSSNSSASAASSRRRPVAQHRRAYSYLGLGPPLLLGPPTHPFSGGGGPAAGVTGTPMTSSTDQKAREWRLSAGRDARRPAPRSAESSATVASGGQEEAQEEEEEGPMLPPSVAFTARRPSTNDGRGRDGFFAPARRESSYGHAGAAAAGSGSASAATKTTTTTTTTRTEAEKRELLRRVMPNVEALEERFRAMGLGLG